MAEKFWTGVVGIGGTTVATMETVSRTSSLGVVSWDVNGWQMIATLFVAIPTGIWMWRQIWMSFFVKKDKQ